MAGPLKRLSLARKRIRLGMLGARSGGSKLLWWFATTISGPTEGTFLPPRDLPVCKGMEGALLGNVAGVI